MGCIETCQNDEQDMEVARLTLTWDVLKPRSPCVIYIITSINFNMGCIETHLTPQML